MAHPLSGFTPVEDSARLIRNYRYAVERMMRILGGWIALTPELSAKLLLGRHVWDNAQHADALGRRLPELRSAGGVSEPANAGVVAFMDAVEAPQEAHQTVERLVAVYGVLKPHLLASYEDHLSRANAVYEPPTLRILARCAEDERRHTAAGMVVLGHLASAPGLADRGKAWQAKLEALLRAAGGVTGEGLPAVVPPAPVEHGIGVSDDPREFIRLEQAGARWHLPEGLASAIGSLAGALIARDATGMRRWLTAGASIGEGVGPALAAPGLTGVRTVAVATVGRQYLVKLRLEGAGGSVTLTTRWVAADEGWRTAALDLVALHTARPA
jgi:hypothetical protein